MNHLFHMDSPLIQFMTKLSITIYLNILWFLCCIPIFTIGASTTALYYVTLKMAENEDGNILRSFFHSFKENFRQATIIWMLLLGIGIFFGIDGYILYHIRFDNAFWTICTALYIAAMIAYAIVLMYIFPLLAHFDNTIPNMLKNAFFIGIRYLFCTILIAVIYFIVVYVTINIFTPVIIFGEGLCAFLSSCLLSNVFRACEKNPRDDTDSEDSI